MKIQTIIISLLITVCLFACSKEGGSSSGGSATKRYVPASAKEIASSPEWKLDFTTKSGIQCYVKPASPEVSKEVANNVDHPDYEYLQQPSDSSQPAYFLVMVRGGAIVEDLKPEEGGEIIGYIMGKDKGFSDVLKEATK